MRFLTGKHLMVGARGLFQTGSQASEGRWFKWALGSSQGLAEPGSDRRLVRRIMRLVSNPRIRVRLWDGDEFPKISDDRRASGQEPGVRLRLAGCRLPSLVLR